MRRWVFPGILLLVGCLEQNKPAAKPLVPLVRVPAVVRQQAMAQYPTVKYHTAWRLPNGGYGLRGRDQKTGNTREVEVSADGSVLSAK